MLESNRRKTEEGTSGRRDGSTGRHSGHDRKRQTCEESYTYFRRKANLLGASLESDDKNPFTRVSKE